MSVDYTVRLGDVCGTSVGFARHLQATYFCHSLLELLVALVDWVSVSPSLAASFSLPGGYRGPIFQVQPPLQLIKLTSQYDSEYQSLPEASLGMVATGQCTEMLMHRDY